MDCIRGAHSELERRCFTAHCERLEQEEKQRKRRDKERRRK
jgi:hypothetical protein